MQVTKTIRLTNLQIWSTLDHVEIEKHSTDDNRSYHVSSEKIRQQLGFNPEKQYKMLLMIWFRTSNGACRTHYHPLF